MCVTSLTRIFRLFLWVNALRIRIIHFAQKKVPMAAFTNLNPSLSRQLHLSLFLSTLFLTHHHNPARTSPMRCEAYLHHQSRATCHIKYEAMTIIDIVNIVTECCLDLFDSRDILLLRSDQSHPYGNTLGSPVVHQRITELQCACVTPVNAASRSSS